MGVAASYQCFGNSNMPCLQSAAQLMDMQNMMPNCGDYYVMHYWAADAAERCILVWRWGDRITANFFADDLGGYLAGFDFPLDHEIWIGVRPNNAIGSAEYNSFTWWAWDKTADEYVEETRDTPVTWTGEGMDVALEMVDENTPNGLKRGAYNLYCLDKNHEEVKLSDCFIFLKWNHPTIIHHHEEIYTENGYKAECIQWKTIEGLEDMVLNINSDPQGQEVVIDGGIVGITPLSETVTCVDHDIMVQPQGVVEYPDLVIEDVWKVGNVIKYRIKNIGDYTAGTSHTKLEVDGVETEVTTEEGLNAGQSREGAFAHFWECSGTEDTIEVVTDCNGEVTEGNEGNNSFQKTIACTVDYPDLVIEDIWKTWNTIEYRIKNIGNAIASSSHTQLEVDGIIKETKTEGGLDPGQVRNESFNYYWECSGDSDNVKVTADCNSEISETEEYNNSLQKVFECASGCIGIDLTPIDVFRRYGRVYFKIKNIGTITAPKCTHAIYIDSGSGWKYKGSKRAGSQSPGSVETFGSSVTWPSTGSFVKVVANKSHSFTDCNPNNDEMEVTA